MNNVDLLLKERTQALIHTVQEHYADIDLAMLKALPEEQNRALDEELHAFESMQNRCKKALFSLDKDAVSQKLLTEYAYDLTNGHKNYPLEHMQNFLLPFTKISHKSKSINAHAIHTYQEDIELIEAALNALKLRIEQLSANKLTSWFKTHKTLCRDYEHFLKTLEPLLLALRSCQLFMHKRLADTVIADFCHIYSYLASLIYYYEDEGNTLLLLEISAHIDTLKDLLHTPLPNRTLSLQELRNNYAFMELLQLQKIIRDKI